ncbi:hypothetical protein U0070_019098 [Myodes glareolus]|uniref:TRASH domain-containing protein n=1 Tax=Myodes glareolus TaxID=447135 RepID=A0AAW0HBY4_MYOGA
MDTSSVGTLELTDQTPVLLGSTAMATSLTNVGNSFSGAANPLVSRSSKFQNSPVEDDDDVVFIEPVQPPPSSAPLVADQRTITFTSSKNEELQGNDPKILPSSKELTSQKGSVSETIVIDDEEDMETNQGQEKNSSHFIERRPSETKNRTNDVDFSTSTFSRSKVNTGMGNSGITTEPDSEIQIANVTTLETGISSVSDGPLESTDGRDMNLMITHVTSLRNTNLGDVSNGLQSSNFGVNIQTYTPSLTSQTKSGVGPFNPGRMNVAGDVFQNGESAPHHNPDSWISQSASFPRNQKQQGVDSLSPVASLPKQIFQPSAQQQPTKPVKVTCANCKKPLQKGQTAYQRKGSAHLFCSTTCLSSFSHKPAPKKLCVMCKKDITTMKGTIVAQVDSSESFQEFCSTSCLSLYEDKQSPAKGALNKSRCTICGKLTEIRHEVSFKNMTHKLCSDHCFNRYRMANGLIMNCCEQCGEYLPSKGAGNNVLVIDGQQKRFCCQSCVSEYKQALSMQSSPNGQFVAPSDIQLKCNYCKNSFCSKPEILEWEASLVSLHNKVHQFCSKTCSDDYKKLHCIVTYCEYCQEEKTLHETVNFSGVKRPFCSEGKCVYNQGCQTSRTKMTGSAPPPSPTPNKEMKNKAVLCKPLTMTKATYCKPHMQTKSCQTVPIPVPVYVPVPMHMYSQSIPVPTTVPVPVPIPVFLPAPLDSSEKIPATVEDVKSKVSSDPLDTDLLTMPDMMTEDEGKTEASNVNSVIIETDIIGSDLTKNSDTDAQSNMPDVPYEPDLDIEIDFPRAAEELDMENEFLLPPVFGEEYEEQPRPRSKKKGTKRKAVSGYQSHDDSSDNSECSFPFKYSYGVNAWKHWVKTRQLDEDLLVLDELKSYLLSHTAAELNYGLAHFVNEIRRPNGENYAPDSIYYLCLGIQEYLCGSNRKDNIFIDPGYQMFEQELNKILRSWQPSILPDDKIATGKRKHEDDEPVPQNLNQRMDVFYLQPECSSSADSPVWYTSTSLDRNTLENMLVRVLLVKDIYDKDNYELDEDTD